MRRANDEIVTGTEVGEVFDVAKLGRMYRMIERILVEIRAMDLDRASVHRLETLAQETLIEIGSAGPDGLLNELSRFVTGVGTSDPTADELRVIESQLLGWLRGMAHADRLESHRRQTAAASADVARTHLVPTGYL